jgi:AbrB family looped-hinge helix DNA binding protein
MTEKYTSNSESFPDFTTISSKGQLVIPKSMRTALGLKDGDTFAANIINSELIVLKKVSVSLTSEDLKSLKKIQAAWNEIDKGMGKRMSKDAFLKELQKW